MPLAAVSQSAWDATGAAQPGAVPSLSAVSTVVAQRGGLIAVCLEVREAFDERDHLHKELAHTQNEVSAV